ncbi:MAG: hypothetical protein F8N15_00895 [Methanobacterium sp.]|nr:hypothetical protein [Methanobacterium sp.]
MKPQNRQLVIYIAGIFLLISGIIGVLLPSLGLSLFTSVVWAVLGAVFLVLAHETNFRKIVMYAEGIFLFVSGILGFLYPQLELTTLNSIIWIILGVLFMYISYSVKY